MIATSRTNRFFLRASTVSASIEQVVPENSENLSSDEIVQLQAFCPRRLTNFLLTASRIQVHSQFRAGCCLLVDVSGFTHLSHIAFTGGSAGLDNFRKNINSILGHLSDTVLEHGGDVIAFAGDALICYFSPTSFSPKNQSMSEYIIRSVSCAVKMCSLRMDGIAVHAAVAAGEACFGVLGGYEDMWTYVMSSPCFDELKQCIADAGPQETVVSMEFYTTHQINLDLYFTPVNTGRGSVQLSFKNSSRPAIQTSERLTKAVDSLDNHLVSLFIPKPALSAVTSGVLAAMGEVRVITSLFLRLDSYNTCQHRDIVTLQPFYIAMQEIIFEYGGFIRQFLIDDKGCVLIVLWGVPGASFPNNCCRAVHCAADMVRKMSVMNHRCSIGISTGTAYCGPVGSSVRKDYVAMSKMVNFAARLMMAARGRILLDASTRDCLPIGLSRYMSDGNVENLKSFMRTSTCFDFNCGEDLLSMERSIDVPRDDEVYAPTEVLSCLENTMSVVMRLKACDSDASRAVVDGASLTHFVFLKGVPGSGKSSIVLKFCRDAIKLQLNVVFVMLNRSFRDDPYGVFRMIIQELAPFQTVQDLLDEFFPDDPTTLHHRKDILEKVMTSNISIATSSKKSVSVKIHPVTCDPKDDTIISLVSRLIQKMSTNAIVIDGAEHVSELSWRLFSQLAICNVAVVVLCALSVKGRHISTDTEFVENVSQHSMTSEHVSHLIQSHGSKAYQVDKSTTRSFTASLHLLLENANTTSITLTPLSFDAVSRQICEAFAHEPVSHYVLQHIYKISQGNAFWVFLLTRFVRDCGMNEFEKLLELHMADNILATCLLSSYTMQQCNIIKVASVCGDEFDVDVLLKVAPHSNKAEIMRALSLFVNGGLLYRSSETRYKFHNTLIKKAVYDMIPKSDAEDIHFKVAQTIGSDEDMPNYIKYPVLAYHLACSGSSRMHYAMRYAHAAAISCVERNNIALAMCYVSLGLRVAASKTDLEKLFTLVDDVATSLSFREDVHRTTIDHVAQLRCSILQAIAKLEDEILRSKTHFLACCFRRIAPH